MLDISFSLPLYAAFGVHVMDANRFPIACFDSSR